MICGRNSVYDGVKSGRVERIYVSENVRNNEKIQEIIIEAKSFKAKVEIVEKKELEKIVKNFTNHQGIAALCKKPAKIEFADFLNNAAEKDNICVIMLTEIEYEQNMGAILRTLNAAGIDGVVISSRIKNYDSMVVKRVSMGAYEHVPMFIQNTFIAAKMLRENGFRIVGVESCGEKPYTNEDLTGKIALVFGGEDKSLSQPVMDVCDDIVVIPMLGAVSSLNVSVSIGVVAYERLRQVVNKLYSQN